MDWEYQFLPVTGTAEAQLEPKVNDLGKDGWELALSYISPSSGAVYFVFKRERDNILDNPDVLSTPNILKK